ncbi:MAG: M20/M25/M40 family metallo-hydrolase [Bacteroidota bacterium]|nr:M20/M25/M40 family metallo-hydrolase [Bacteroidota bacterium]MDP4234403.1 M20/M25/M40 family metallo-hydrolase [Bacteroidota bacterium]MDP4243335.1 M20/M25/M40 family metallo-hydrolase [Bacteroidota bacterium]MDP4288021.1 M20/M25/M40 family metallo-hydrolase [Bacteroidota bacterium]
MIRSKFLSLTLTVVLLVFVASSRAQMTGFSAASQRTELSLEKKLVGAIVPDTLRAIVTAISKEVHVAGTPAQARTRDYVIGRWKRAGLSAQVYPYEVSIPLAKRSSLELLSPVKKVFTLKEDKMPSESNSNEYPWVNGYSASGTVSGDLVYVNYGLPQDYRELDSLGISVKGTIVIARYGRCYRGIKARVAEDAGVAGLIIFSDPSGDGYDAGDVFPVGPMRPSGGVQRGSIYNGHGDPTTPGYASVPGARRAEPDSMYPTPTIPVIPISYGVASQILSKMHGRDIPNSNWQGGLGFRYHISGGPSEKARVRVKLTVETDPGLKPIWNTVARVEGSTWPDEWIIIGGHRDAWGYGAEDNAAGCASVVAAAEAFGKLASEGIRPKRSVLFVTWDAEEWGLLGSTEWVEQLEKELGANAIAYINQDECATGSAFSAGADPTLRSLVYEVSQSLLDASGHSVYSEWSKNAGVNADGEDKRPAIGLLGGGSDFSAFYNHLGIPSLEHGFGGPFGQYHSNHDNIGWTLHQGDSTFQYHALTSQFAAVEAMRLANAEILPFDFAELAHWLSSAVQKAKRTAFRDTHDSSGFGRLENAIGAFTAASKDFAEARDKNGLSEGSPLRTSLLGGSATQDSLNREIRNVGYAFVAPDGLFFDTWERNMLVLSDPDNGYSDVELPAIDIAVRRKNHEQKSLAIEALTRATMQATDRLRKIVRMLDTL